MECMVFSGIPRPWRSISKAPLEVDVGPISDPTRQHNSLINQDRGLIEEPVKLHCLLNTQWEHIWGQGGLATEHDYHHIVPESETEETGWASTKMNKNWAKKKKNPSILNVSCSSCTCRACWIFWWCSWRRLWPSLSPQNAKGTPQGLPTLEPWLRKSRQCLLDKLVFLHRFALEVDASLK